MRKTLNCMIFFILFSAGVSYSHPHLFIETKVTVIFDEEGISGIETRWIFDEMYSSALIEDYDTDQNGKLNKQESDALKKGAFDNIAKYKYFSYIKIDGKEFNVERIEKFEGEIFLNQICYNFFIPCPVKAKKSDREIKISM